MTTKQNKTKGLRGKIEKIIKKPKLDRSSYTKEWRRLPRARIITNDLVKLFKKEMLGLVGKDWENQPNSTLFVSSPKTFDSSSFEDGFNQAKAELREKVEKL